MKYLILKSVFFLSVFALHAQRPAAILTDIEGTTTSISFVYDTLFPYAKEHVRDYLLAHHHEPNVAQLIQEVAQIAEIPHEDLSAVTQTLLTWMQQDKKITPLKTLQGMLWKEGFEEGCLQGHVYRDAFEELEQWHQQGIALYVFSSGSVSAQKLLFGYTPYGDLTPYFSGYFDTKVGGKKESSSYCNIAEYLALAPEQILFLSDVVEELDAAATAGMQTCLIVREGTARSSAHPSAVDFHKVFRE